MIIRHAWLTAACLCTALFAATAAAADLRLSSPDFAEGAMLAPRYAYNGYGCSGGNVSPALRWSGAPEEARSYAVTVHDPDAPRTGGWWHWLVVDIPADVTRLRQGASSGRIPEGAVETRTSFGSPGYGGPCPPQGDAPHRYRFMVRALDTDKLGVSPDASPAEVLKRLRAHTLARARTTAKYSR